MEPGALPAVLGIMALARLGILLDGAIRGRHGPEVFFPLPQAAAGIVEDRDAGKIDRTLAARVVATVLHVDYHATGIRVDRVPFVRGVELGILLHDRLDPTANRLAALQVAEHVLDVVRVLKGALPPRVPALAH